MATAPKGRLQALQHDLERGYMKPTALRSTPAPLEVVVAMPTPDSIPHEGQTVVPLPRLGETPMTTVVCDDGSRQVAPVPPPTGTNPQQLSRRYTPQIIERLVQHALSDDYRASIPACNILLERAYGKARQAEPEAEQTAIDMSALPVRERIKALLEGRGLASAKAPAPTEPSPAPAEDAPDSSVL